MTESGFLAGDEAIALWEEGPKAWNKWADSHPDWNVSFKDADFTAYDEVDFTGYRFPMNGIVSFDNAQFGDGSVSFLGAQFGDGIILFAGNRFGESSVSFLTANIKGHIQFAVGDAGTTLTSLNFFGARLDGGLSLVGSFTCIPDLRQTILTGHSDLSRVRVNPISKSILGWTRHFPDDEKAASKLRRLKELAEANRHHEAALAFHALEKQAERWSAESPENWPKNKLLWAGYWLRRWVRNVLDLTYSTLSNYGQSIGRPGAGLILVWALFAYLHMAELETTGGRHNTAHTDAWILSGTSMVPFIPTALDARREATKRLYGRSMPPCMRFWTLVQGGLSAILLFLLGLGLRNRFRL